MHQLPHRSHDADIAKQEQLCRVFSVGGLYVVYGGGLCYLDARDERERFGRDRGGFQREEDLESYKQDIAECRLRVLVDLWRVIIARTMAVLMNES